MDTRNILKSRCHARGAIRLETLAIVGIFILFAAGAWWFIVRPVLQQRQLDAGGAPAAVTVAGKTPAAAPSNLQALDVNQLLDEASKALKAKRLLAPAGNNAFEFYLRALAKQPGNPVATSALRETYPYAANDAEQSINAHNYDEAQREINLLAKADPANFTLTILRSKLDAQRKLATQQQQQAADQQKAAQLAAQKAAADKAAATKLAEEQKAQAAAEQAAKAKQVAAVPVAAAPKPQPAAPTGVTSDAVVLKQVAAAYPTAALRSGTGGWVIVGFTIMADGRPADVHVVESQPRRVFDRSAMEAVSRYRFKPAMRNGVAVSTQTTQKIEFNNGR